MSLDINTTSMYPTHFLRGVELVKRAREYYGIPSENWPAPTRHRFGIPNDNYYSEVWSDGMDWQTTYWIIEELDLEKPQIQPLIIFNHHEEQEKLNHYDFGQIINAACYYRRDKVWIKRGKYGVYTDSIWPFISLFKNEVRYEQTKLYAFEHASQERVVFWMNTDFIPEAYREENRNRRNTQTGYSISPTPN